uniref:Uncharacterized protein n=1 Tax=Arundo donax TaxID=35708 RepID=A0A0A9H6D5_ARUDO
MPKSSNSRDGKCIMKCENKTRIFDVLMPHHNIMLGVSAQHCTRMCNLVYMYVSLLSYR